MRRFKVKDKAWSWAIEETKGEDCPTCGASEGVGEGVYTTWQRVAGVIDRGDEPYGVLLDTNFYASDPEKLYSTEEEARKAGEAYLKRKGLP